jgi:hypothetical protein
VEVEGMGKWWWMEEWWKVDDASCEIIPMAEGL